MLVRLSSNHQSKNERTTIGDTSVSTITYLLAANIGVLCEINKREREFVCLPGRVWAALPGRRLRDVYPIKHYNFRYSQIFITEIFALTEEKASNLQR